MKTVVNIIRLLMGNVVKGKAVEFNTVIFNLFHISKLYLSCIINYPLTYSHVNIKLYERIQYFVVYKNM